MEKSPIEILQTNKSQYRAYLQLCQLDSLRDRYRGAIGIDPGYADNINQSKVIWSLWLQGADQAPAICRRCWESFRRHYPEYDLRVLDRKSLREHASLPQWIEDKFDRGEIRAPHYSDIARLFLLIQHGGAWADATVYCTGRDETLFRNRLFAFKADAVPHLASNWFLVAGSQNPILMATRDFLLKYHEEHERTEYYFIFHYFFRMAAEMYPKAWKQVPYFSNRPPHVMQHELGRPYDKARFDQIKAMSTIHKLRWKKLPEADSEKLTIYQYLLQGEPKNTKKASEGQTAAQESRSVPGKGVEGSVPAAAHRAEIAPLKLILWIAGQDTTMFRHAITQLARMAGAVAAECFVSDSGGGSCALGGKKLAYLPKEGILQQAYDAILVAGCMTDRQRILQECRTLGIDESKVFFDFELCIPAYTHPKAIRLHRSRVSILSVNGWGKKLCQRFRVPMLSPFAGCAMSAEDWLSFLESPREHLSRELVFFDRIQNADGVEFPVFRMGKDGLAVYMLEETDTKKIQREWAGRVQSMNWSDLLVMTYTDSPEMLDRFDRLPYAKKICFTSFESLLGSAFYLPKEQDGSGNDLPLWASVDRLAESARPCYDLWDMLLYGRRTSVRYA